MDLDTFDLEAAVLRSKFDPSQPRDSEGRWTSTGASGAGISALYGGHAGTPEDPVPCGDDIERAAHVIGHGGNVTLNQPDEVATLLDLLRDIVKDAESKGEKAPTYDLCKVSVPGTNLFCQDSLGIDRVQMPQLSTKDPVPGSAADQMPRNAKGEVDLSKQFGEFLASSGREPTHETRPASHLRASQNELNGAKVAGIAGAVAAGKIDVNDPAGAIYVTEDNYVIDGHHRWAAYVAEGLRTGNEIDMPVTVVPTDIGTALTLANFWTEQMGIPPADVTKKSYDPWLFRTLGRIPEMADVIAKFAEDQPRDSEGRWVDTGGAEPPQGTVAGQPGTPTAMVNWTRFDDAERRLADARQYEGEHVMVDLRKRESGGAPSGTLRVTDTSFVVGDREFDPVDVRNLVVYGNWAKAFDPDLHPRDSEGRFAETPGGGSPLAEAAAAPRGTAGPGFGPLGDPYRTTYAELPDKVYHVAPASERYSIEATGLDASGNSWNWALSQNDRAAGGYWNPETQSYEGAGSEDYGYRPEGVYVFADGQSAAEYAQYKADQAGGQLEVYEVDALGLLRLPKDEQPDLLRNPEQVQAAHMDDTDMEEPPRSVDEIFADLENTDYGEGERDYREWVIERVPPEFARAVKPYEIKDQSDWTDEDIDAYYEDHPEEDLAKAFDPALHPRDSEGRFAETPGVALGRITPGYTDAGDAGNGKLDNVLQAFQDANNKPETSSGALWGALAAGVAKTENVKRIGVALAERAKDDPELAAQLTTVGERVLESSLTDTEVSLIEGRGGEHAGFGLRIGPDGLTVGEPNSYQDAHLHLEAGMPIEQVGAAEIASRMQDTWMMSASNMSPMSWGLQLAVADRVGLDTREAENFIRTNRVLPDDSGVALGLPPLMTQVDPDTRVRRIANSPAVKAYVDEVYGQTQKLLKSEGISEITVYRGVHLPHKAHVNERTRAVDLNPLSSFTIDDGTAEQFAHVERFTENAYVFTATVPASRVFSVPLTGPGCLDETELLVAGGPDVPVKVRAI